MSALRFAIDQVGGVAECARICGISPRGVYKWLHRESLPRTEYTGETRYAERMAAASGGAFTSAWLLENAGPGSEPQSSPEPTSQPRPVSREQTYRGEESPKTRRAYLITQTIELAKLADERRLHAKHDPSAAREEAETRVKFHRLSAELLTVTPATDAQEAAQQQRDRHHHLAEADWWQRRLLELEVPA